MENRTDIFIQNALVFNGSLSGPFIANIAICGDRIAYIGNEEMNGAGLVIDAKEMAVSPGFIDTHAHSDFTILADPRAEGKISQGVTTEINGNCGMSAAPLFKKAIERREEDFRELGIKERWNTLKEYFFIVERQGTGVNIANLAGHGNIRGSVMGYENEKASGLLLAAMKTMLSETLDQGAIGFSTGLIYPPGIYSDTDELSELSLALRGEDLIYTSHMRSEGNSLMEAVDEVIRIGSEAGVKVHISHIKTAGDKNWHKADAVIARLNEARKTGLRLTCDRYPYIASSTDLDAILPSWTFAGGNDEELKRLQDPAVLKKIREEMKDQVSAPGYWKKVIISSVSTKGSRWMEGRTIEEVSSKLGMDGLSAFFRIIVDEKLRAGAIYLSMSEDNLKKFLALPFCMIGSDSSARCFDGPTASGKPHPRTFGSFPRLFGKYVREERLLGLSEAVHKSTMLAAVTFGLKGRGRIKEGYSADLVIFDPEKIIDKATFDNPFKRADGIHHVFVNGVPALSEGRLTGRRAGRVLRHGG
jgi:N-acyl-D-amino-acid deacylase